MKLLNLIIARVDGPVFTGDVVSVALPGTDGDLELFANHEPFISPLRGGDIRIKKADGEVSTVTISSGTIEVSNNHATVLI